MTSLSDVGLCLKVHLQLCCNSGVAVTALFIIVVAVNSHNYNNNNNISNSCSFMLLCSKNLLITSWSFFWGLDGIKVGIFLGWNGHFFVGMGGLWVVIGHLVWKLFQVDEKGDATTKSARGRFLSKTQPGRKGQLHSSCCTFEGSV